MTTMRARGENPESDGKWLAGVLLLMGGIVATVVAVLGTGVIGLPGAQRNTASSPRAAQAALAAQRTAANKRWAATTCTDILDWKNEIHHDETSLSLSFGPLARIQDAVSATGHMLNELDKWGLPPGAQTAQGRTDTEQLRAEIGARVQSIEGAGSRVAGGDVGAVGTLLGDLGSDDRIMGTQIVGQLRRVVSVDLGLSLAETRACRQLVGIPV